MRAAGQSRRLLFNSAKGAHDPQRGLEIKVRRSTKGRFGAEWALIVADWSGRRLREIPLLSHVKTSTARGCVARSSRREA